MKLKPNEKKYQMTKKYGLVSEKNILDRISATSDLQGWRNKLVDASMKFKVSNILDFGGGCGDKSARASLKSKYQKLQCDIVDFSTIKESIKVLISKYGNLNFFCSEAEYFVEHLWNKNYDLIFMFGFLHELSNANSFLSKVTNKLQHNSIIVFSDNDLYMGDYQVLKAFKKAGLYGVLYKNSWSFCSLHKFICVDSVGERPLYFWHRGRVDKLFGYFANNSKINRNKLIGEKNILGL